MRAGARLYGIGFVERWRDMDIAELTVLLTDPEETGDGHGEHVRSSRELAAQRRAYEEGRGPKPEVAPSGHDLLAKAMQFPGMVVGDIPEPPRG